MKPPVKGCWHEVIDANAKKLELAGKLGASTSFNAAGSEALAKVIRKMAAIIDTEIENREKPTKFRRLVRFILTVVLVIVCGAVFISFGYTLHWPSFILANILACFGPPIMSGPRR